MSVTLNNLFNSKLTTVPLFSLSSIKDGYIPVCSIVNNYISSLREESEFINYKGSEKVLISLMLKKDILTKDVVNSMTLGLLEDNCSNVSIYMQNDSLNKEELVQSILFKDDVSTCSSFKQTRIVNSSYIRSFGSLFTKDYKPIVLVLLKQEYLEKFCLKLILGKKLIPESNDEVIIYINNSLFESELSDSLQAQFKLVIKENKLPTIIDNGEMFSDYFFPFKYPDFSDLNAKSKYFKEMSTKFRTIVTNRYEKLKKVNKFRPLTTEILKKIISKGDVSKLLLKINPDSVVLDPKGRMVFKKYSDERCGSFETPINTIISGINLSKINEYTFSIYYVNEESDVYSISNNGKEYSWRYSSGNYWLYRLEQ
jgi:hypothetical protein